MSVLPGFDVLAVELRHIQVKGTSKIREEEGTYDLFIKNDLSLSRTCPSELLLKEVTVVKVNLLVSLILSQCCNRAIILFNKHIHYVVLL